MVQRTLWTERRFTGLLLTLGGVLYVAALACMPRDAQGTFLVLLPERAMLFLIAAHPTLTQWSFGLFITGSIITPLGLALLTRLLQEAGDRTWSFLGLIVALFGAVPWVIYLGVSLGSALLAAQDTLSTGVVPSYYAAVGTTIQPLFIVYTLLTLAALLAYGGAILTTRGVLPQWVGWVTIVYTLFNLASAGFAGGNVAPIVHYLMPLVMGILLLRRASRKENQREEVSPAPIPSAVPGGER
jgi:hypothetical protein